MREMFDRGSHLVIGVWVSQQPAVSGRTARNEYHRMSSGTPCESLIRMSRDTVLSRGALNNKAAHSPSCCDCWKNSRSCPDLFSSVGPLSIEGFNGHSNSNAC